MQSSRIEPQQPSRELAIVRGPRQIRDSKTGEVTTLVERRAEGVAGARASTCMLISTDRGFIRLWDYPENWCDMTDTALLALAARPVRLTSI